jgi:transcriptional regulator with XRE-family HTH domain
MARPEPPPPPPDNLAWRFGCWLAEERRAKGWSQADLAEYAHITTRETIARYERGEREPRLGNLVAILNALGRDAVTAVRACAPLPPVVEGASQRAKAQELLEQIAARDPRALTLAVAALEGIAREVG